LGSVVFIRVTKNKFSAGIQTVSQRVAINWPKPRYANDKPFQAGATFFLPCKLKIKDENFYGLSEYTFLRI
jgi:hypothetical protein